VDRELEQRILGRKWFYRFVLPGGAVTETYIPDEVIGIHTTRERMTFQALDPIFAGRWDTVSCIDLACHEGYFANKLAERGCERVLGIDARAQHVEHANLIRDACGRGNLTFQVGDVTGLDPRRLGTFDVVLMYGLLYHLENPIGAIRQARALTGRVCLIETQVAPNLSGVTDWGSYRTTMPILGCFAMVDETAEIGAQNMETNLTAISLFPSLEALLWVMRAVGFTHVEVVQPPPDAYEQLATGKRVIVAGYVDTA
jgi:hypothetical protein